MKSEKGSNAAFLFGQRTDRVYYFVLAVASCYILLFGWYTRSFFVDDAFIGLRYADNVASGLGLFFNPGERVEGVSNIGWIIVLSLASLLVDAAVAAKILGLLLVLATLTLVTFIALHLPKSSNSEDVWFLMPIMVATQFEFLYFSVAGMETAFMSALLCLLVYLAQRDRSGIAMALASPVLFLIHPEGLLVFPTTLLVGHVAGVWELRKRLTSIIIFLVAVALITFLRYSYFQDVLPNTFYAKKPDLVRIIGETIRLLKSRSWSLPGLFGGISGILVIGYGAMCLFRTRPVQVCYMLGILASGLLFSIYSMGDWTLTARYFGPYLPIAMLLFWNGITNIIDRLFSDGLRWLGRSCFLGLLAAAVIAVGIGTTVEYLAPRKIESYPGYVMTSRNLVAPSVWIRENTPASAVIACGRIGTLGYYSKRNIFDWGFGLTNKEVAAHSYEMSSLWKSVRPNYVLLEPDRPELWCKPCSNFFDFDYCLVKKWNIGREGEQIRWWALYERKGE